MSEKDNNLTPWQQKHLEYQKRKAEEAKKEKKANQPKKVHFSSPFLKSLPKTEKNFDDTRDEAESAELLEEGFETNNKEIQSSEAPIENEKIIAQLEQLSQEHEYEYEEEQIKRPSRFSSLFKGSAPLLKKMWPALAIVVLVFVGSLYLISPLSKISTFSVSGNANESSEQVALASGIQTSDSIFNILNNKEKIEATIEQKFPRISAVTINYHFPNRFEAIVKEHTNSVYVKRNNQTYLVLNNGYVITTPVDATKLEKLPVLQNFNDKEVKTFVNAYETLKPAIKSLMTNVTKTPTDATKDFIAIDMSDGNQVRVSLSQLADRLPYYPSVAKQVQAPQVVDMEAGIYTKPKAAYDAYLSQLSTSKSASISAQNAKKTDASSENTAQSTTTSSN